MHALRGKPVPLPDPLPDEPPVPFGYITRLGNQMAEKELSPQQQLQLLVELRSGLDEDGDDPSARGDIAQLLRMLRLRHDVTYRTRSEIDNVLAEIEAKDGPHRQQAPQPKPRLRRPLQRGPTEAAARAPPRPAAATAVSGGAATGGGSNKRLLIIGGAAVAVIAAIAIVVVLTTQGGKTKSAPTRATVVRIRRRLAARFGSESGCFLEAGFLSARRRRTVGTIVGRPEPGCRRKNQSAALLPKWTLSSPKCAGSYEPAVAAGYQGASGLTALSAQVVHTPDKIRPTGSSSRSRHSPSPDQGQRIRCRHQPTSGRHAPVKR